MVCTMHGVAAEIVVFVAVVLVAFPSGHYVVCRTTTAGQPLSPLASPSIPNPSP